MQNLAKALLEAQKELPALRPDAVNPHFQSDFVSLDKLLRAARPVLNKHGIVVMQSPAIVDGQPALTTRFIHAESGEQLESTMLLLSQRNDPQGQGSALTYARRYALTAELAIAEGDDDGEAATRGEVKGQKKQQAPASKEAASEAVGPAPADPSKPPAASQAQKNLITVRRKQLSALQADHPLLERKVVSMDEATMLINDLDFAISEKAAELPPAASSLDEAITKDPKIIEDFEKVAE